MCEAFTPDDTLTGTFVADYQADTYCFDGTEGDQLELETMRFGSTRGLDNKLSLLWYNPGILDWVTVDTDDNSGFSALAYLGSPGDELYLPHDGEYMLVVGTSDNRGRGDYTVRTECVFCSW